MSSDIEKLSVLDSRIVQSRPKFAVEKGALSLTNAPFNAIAATSSQHTYNIYVPSENVFVDRKLLWSSDVLMKCVVTLSSLPTVGDSIVVAGRDFALCALPLNQLCSTLSATINDTTSVINTQDVLREVLRLADKKKNRLVRTAPTMLDKYQNYNDAFGTLNNPLGGYDSMLDYDNVPNGAFPYLEFTNDAGAVLPAVPAGGAGAVAFAGASYSCVNGVPTFAPALGGAAAGLVHTIYFRWRTAEPLVLSPFVFSDECEWDTGLFGINNIQLIMNLVNGPSRIIRQSTRAGRTLSAIEYNTNAPFQRSVVNCQFLTPSLDVPLPPKSVVPYMEFPRYISQPVTINAGASEQVSSQTITLPCIPDLLIIYAKPSDGYKATEADWYFPLSAENQPLTVNFDNFSGLLSSSTREQLYQMSVHNGLEMDYASWSGLSHSASGSYSQLAVAGVQDAYSRQQGQQVPAVGGMLVLKPSQDLTLQSGQAPSLVGNFTLQFNIRLRNPTTENRNAQLVVITANSGFFESIRGSSRIIKGVLSEQDIISAPLAPMGVRAELDRIVGGFSFSSLANILSKARDVYQQTKPLVSAAKGLLPQDGMLGSLRSGLDAVGYGTGGGTGGRNKKSLASRLM